LGAGFDRAKGINFCHYVYILNLIWSGFGHLGNGAIGKGIRARWGIWCFFS